MWTRSGYLYKLVGTQFFQPRRYIHSNIYTLIASIYVHLCMYVYVCVCVYMYIYIDRYICTYKLPRIPSRQSAVPRYDVLHVQK